MTTTSVHDRRRWVRHLPLLGMLAVASLPRASAFAQPKALEGRKAAPVATKPLTGYGRITWQTTQEQLESEYGAVAARDASPATTPPGANVLSLPKYPSPQYRDADVIEHARGIIVKVYKGLPYQIVVPYSFVLQRDDKSGGLVIDQAEKDLGRATTKFKNRPAPEEVMRAVQIPYERADAQVIAEWKDKDVSAYLVFSGFGYGEPKYRQLVIINEGRWKAIVESAAAASKADEEDKPAMPTPTAAAAEEDEPEKPASVVGWRDFRFGDSIETVKRKFPDMAVPAKSPFKDTKPLDTVKTFAVRGTWPEVKGVFLRFHKNRLYYIAVGFNYDELHVRDYKGLLMKLRPEIGEPSNVKTVPKAGHRLLTVIATWARPEFGAQLVFNQQYYMDPGEAVLHVVSEALDKQVQAELNGN
jgi:hypothetical protein